MAHHQLKNTDAARKHLEQLRSLLQSDRWKDDPESQAFLREAEQLTSGPPRIRPRAAGMRVSPRGDALARTARSTSPMLQQSFHSRCRDDWHTRRGLILNGFCYGLLRGRENEKRPVLLCDVGAAACAADEGLCALCSSTTTMFGTNRAVVWRRSGCDRIEAGATCRTVKDSVTPTKRLIPRDGGARRCFIGSGRSLSSA